MKNRKIVLLAVLLLCSFVIIAQAAETPSKQVLFTNVKIFNGVDDKLTDGHVLVENNLIKKVSTKLIPVNRSANTKVIDGGGKTLMPGLIDSHSHLNVLMPGGLKELEAATWDRIATLAAGAAQEMLMEGFTTIRDMGGMATGLKQTIDEGSLDGPRIYPSGAYISQTAGHGDLTLASQQRNPQDSNLVRLGITDLADGTDAVHKAVRNNLAQGATQIKIMMGGGISSEKGPLFASQFTDDEVRAAVEEAATRDTYVATHIYQAAHIKRALNLGVKSIEHGQFIDEEGAKLLKNKGAFIAPFTTGFSNKALKHPVYGKKGTPQYIKAKEFQENSKNFAALMKKIKPKVVLAIDVVFLTGMDARRQRDFEKWTFTETLGNHMALMGMTSIAGELASLTGKNNPYPEGKLGVIEVGAYADLLIVDGNPLKDITAIGANPKYFDSEPRTKGIPKIKLIMKDGKIYKNTL
ncbi:MAG: amidohydrolase family protein [Planctomycetes bacterium]|nr:amidohydrolase family protein [Planctomycetota bacterium]